MTHADTMADWLAVAAVGLVSAILGCALGVLRSRTKFVTIKALAAASLIVTCITSPMLVSWMTDELNTTEGFTRVFIEIGVLQAWLPAACAIAAVVIAGEVANRAVRRSTQRNRERNEKESV